MTLSKKAILFILILIQIFLIILSNLLWYKIWPNNSIFASVPFSLGILIVVLETCIITKKESKPDTKIKYNKIPSINSKKQVEKLENIVSQTDIKPNIKLKEESGEHTEFLREYH